jgi:hypothetical protein
VAFVYQSSISADTLNGLVSAGRLAMEIEASSIVATLLSVQTDGDDLALAFQTELSSAEETTLTNVIAAHAGDPLRGWESIQREGEIEPVIPGASKVVANDRPAIEVADGITGFAALQAVWPLPQADYAELRVRVYFILKSSGSGSTVRIAARMKTESPGDDSSDAFQSLDFVGVPVTFDTVGEVFAAQIVLPAAFAEMDDVVAFQVGRDGSNSLGAGDNDDVTQPIQIIGLRMEGR